MLFLVLVVTLRFLVGTASASSSLSAFFFFLAVVPFALGAVFLFAADFGAGDVLAGGEELEDEEDEEVDEREGDDKRPPGIARIVQCTPRALPAKSDSLRFCPVPEASCHSVNVANKAPIPAV